LLLGPLPGMGPGDYPRNVSFVAGNVLDMPFGASPDPLEGSFDTIICWSTTKWIHLNWGDEGIKTLFRMVHDRLVPGGIFLLEPQPFQTYRRKHTLTEDIKRVFKTIQFRPEEFVDFLVKEYDFELVKAFEKEIPEKSAPATPIPAKPVPAKHAPANLAPKPKIHIHFEEEDLGPASVSAAPAGEEVQVSNLEVKFSSSNCDPGPASTSSQLDATGPSTSSQLDTVGASGRSPLDTTGTASSFQLGVSDREGSSKPKPASSGTFKPNPKGFERTIFCLRKKPVVVPAVPPVESRDGRPGNHDSDICVASSVRSMNVDVSSS